MSCDLNYSDDKNLDFISLEDGTCYEITGLSDTLLAFRHTASGSLQIFYKSEDIN